MNVTRSILTLALVIVAQQALGLQAWGQGAPAPDLEAIVAHSRIVKTLDDIKADDERAFAEQKRITEIPAPPFKEKVRAEFYQKRMQELGFKDASIDGEGNVIALRKGTGGGRPKLVVSAHLDTVFPEGTDVAVKEKDGGIVAPGIGDDSRRVHLDRRARHYPRRQSGDRQPSL
jgi:tripeptide aminopeptidase